MIIFWILAGGLLTLALAFVIVPLLKPTPAADFAQQDALNLEVFRQRLRELDADLAAGFLEQDQYDAARHDLERELLYDVSEAAVPSEHESRRGTSALSRLLLGAALTLSLPVAAVFGYLQLGQPSLIDPLQAAASGSVASAEQGASGPSLEELIERLEARLKETPDDLQGWLMLGRTYFATDQVQKGLAAIEKAYALAPDQTEIKLAYAEALAGASPTKSLEGRPAALINEVLEQDPTNDVARWLGGMVSFQQGRYAEAVAVWKAVLSGLEPGSQEAANLQEMIAAAEARVDPSGDRQTATAQSASDAAVEPAPAEDLASPAGQTRVTVSVELSPDLADRAAPQDTVFVFARAADGPPMPLAVQRLQVKDLPATVVLDDSMAMTPAMRLSAFPDVVIGARVSKSGDAMPKSGDLFGETDALSLAQETAAASVTVDRVKP